MLNPRLPIFLLALVALFAPALPAWALSITERQVVELVRERIALSRQVPVADVNVVWRDVKLASMVPTLPEGSVSLQLVESAQIGDRGTVPVQILVAGRKFRTIFPRMDVKVFQKVLVAKASISRGAVPNRSDVELRRQAVSGPPGALLTSLAPLAGAEAVRDLPAGTVLKAEMFRLAPVIKAGDDLSVTVTSGDLTILGRAIARQPGTVGQVVKVLNPDSKKEFSARVTGPGRVEVNLEE